MSCPHCRALLPAPAPRCPSCDGDLSALAGLSDFADRHFTLALRAARDGRWHDAAESVAVTLALHPHDVEAVLVAAKVARRQGRPERCHEMLHRAAELGAERDELDRVRRPLPPGPAPDPVGGAVPVGVTSVLGLARAAGSAGSAALRHLARSARGTRRDDGRG